MKKLAAIALSVFAATAQADLDWDTALNGEHRSDANKARNEYRHPRETLEFFGLSEGMTVVEVSPGGGWYTEVLAPLLKDNGMLYTAHFGLNAGNAYYRNALGKFLQKLAADAEIYDPVLVTQLQPPVEVNIAPAGTADLAVTFRNVHGWLRGDSAEATLAAIYAALKPGGTFGLVQHRAKPGTDLETMKKSGYVTEAEVIRLAEAAGFKLADRSEVNANPKDTADYPEGVWTLPPALRLGDTDRAKYEAIGESDRMTLKFTKPVS